LSLTETPEAGPSPVANMAAEVARRAALIPGAVQPKVEAPVKENVAPVEAPKTASGATDKVATGAAATPTTPATPPSASAGQDVSWVPEEFRSFAEKADEKALAKLRETVEKAKDYTQKTMTLADQRKAFEAERERVRVEAEYGAAILKDKALAQKVNEWAQAEEPKPEPFDYLSATSEEIVAHEAALEQRAVEKALAALRAERDADIGSHNVMRTMANKAHAEFVASGEYDKAAVNAAYERLSSMGVQFSPDNVVEALRLALPKKAATPPVSPPVTTTPEAPTSGASALSRGAGVAPAYRVPAFIRDGKGPQTRDERIAQSFYEVNKARAAKGLPPLGSASA